MKLTQLEQVKEYLLKNKEISRNWALKNYISRLSAIIYIINNELKRTEIDFRYIGEYQKTKKGVQDYVYKLRHKNYKKNNNIAIGKWISIGIDKNFITEKGNYTDKYQKIIKDIIKQQLN